MLESAWYAAWQTCRVMFLLWFIPAVVYGTFSLGLALAMGLSWEQYAAGWKGESVASLLMPMVQGTWTLVLVAFVGLFLVRLRELVQE